MSKKEARLLNKKRKIEALAAVSDLNESDRERSQPRSVSQSGSDGEPHTKRTRDIDDNSPATDDNPRVITDTEYKLLKHELNAKKRELKNVPKLRLKLFGDSASLAVGADIRTPIFTTDLQHLVMYAMFGHLAPCKPSRWCTLERPGKISHTVVLVVEGLSLYHFTSYESIFKNCTNIFENKLEMVTANRDDSKCIINELITIPCTDAQKAALIEKFGSLEAALDSTQDPVLLVKSIFPVDENEGVVASLQQKKETDTFPRTQLLLSALQMVDEGYPLPLRGELANRYKEYVFTKDSYQPVTANSPMYGLDCEMCRTSTGANELTRISIVNEEQESIYETLVCPKNKIVDYLTHFSGITPEMMKNVTKTLDQVQQDVRRVLPADAILVGQSLQSDLMAMRMMHPYVIDTSIIFNLSGDRRRKSKLQTLSHEFLGESIQKNPLGHDSIEDCSASLKLTKLKLNKGIDFGDAILAARRRFHEVDVSTSQANGHTENGVGINNGHTAPTPTTLTTTGSNKKDRSAVVITADKTNSTDYQSLIKDKFVTNGQNDLTSSNNSLSIEQTNIKILRNNSNKEAVESTCHAAINYALTLTHVNVDDSTIEDDKIEKTLKKVDRWIGNIWESIAPHGLLAVVLGGNVPGATSGVALLQVKK